MSEHVQVDVDDNEGVELTPSANNEMSATKINY